MPFPCTETVCRGPLAAPKHQYLIILTLLWLACVGMTYGGQPVYGSPLFNPLLPATAFQFQVLPV